MLSINTLAPDFTLLDQNGTQQSLSDYRGSYVLLYFYPKDDTPGCTKEACVITEMYSDFEQAGIQVLGVSSDSVQSHKKFAEKYHLPFTLLADTEKTVIENYEAGGMIGTKRVSYLINPEGNIMHVFPSVTPADHAGEVLALVRGYMH